MAGDAGLLIGGGWERRRRGVGWKRRAVYNNVKPTRSPISPATAFSSHLITRTQMPHNTAPRTSAFSQRLLLILIGKLHIRLWPFQPNFIEAERPGNPMRKGRRVKGGAVWGMGRREDKGCLGLFKANGVGLSRD